MPTTPKYLPRYLEPLVGRRLEAFPVIVVTGARQTGKSTLARRFAGRDRPFLTLDDIDLRDQAETAPDQLIGRAPTLIVDEVQRSPEFLLAIKRTVDRDRAAGRFLLTGSANLLMMEKISESLAGRAIYLTLSPLTAGELAGEGRAGVWSELFDEQPPHWRELLLDRAVEPGDPWQDRVRRGGYPVPSLHLAEPEEREQWFDGYVRTYLERDLRELSAIEHLADYQRLMRASCSRLGGLLNQADLARDVGLPPSTVQRYLGLLETSYQLVRVEAFAVNRTKRLVKSPKIYWSDPALALFLSGETRSRGAHLENLVLADLLVWREGKPRRPQVLFWRTSKGAEVDFVVEWGTRVLPIEVKSGARVSPRDLRPMRTFLEEYPDLAPGGVVLYGGEDTYWADERILVTPWWRVL